MWFIVVFFAELFLLFVLSQLLTRALSGVLLRVTRSQTITIHILAFLFLPGVIIHELAHLLVASLLFVRTGEIEFLPQIKEDGVKLGSVAIAKTDPLRRALIGIAPFLVGTGLLLSSIWYFTSPDFFPEMSFALKMFFLGYIVFEIGNTMFSSKKDMEGTVELLGALLFIIAVAYFLGVRIPADVLLFFQQEQVAIFFTQCSLFLLLPLVIDLLVYAGAKLFLRH